MRNAALAILGAVTLGGVSALAASWVQPAHTNDIATRDRTPVHIADPVDGHLAQRDHVTSAAEARGSVAQRETAPSNTPRVMIDEGIEVQARRLPGGSPVAVSGEIAAASGKVLIIARPDGRVHVRLPGEVPALMPGDDVTVYGRLINRGDRIALQAEAVLQHTSFDQATLHLAPSRLESVSKFNRPIGRGAARNALDHYRFTYTAL